LDKPLFDQKASSVYRPLGLAFLRVPILPAETASSLLDPIQMVERSPLLREAISIASPSLVDALSRRQTMAPRKMRQLQSSLLKYILRSSTRTTPFGLFSGIASIPIGDQTAVALAPPSNHRHRTRVDMEWLLGYIHMLENIPSIQAQLTYTYQPIMIKVGDRYHFEFRNTEGKVTDISVLAATGVELLITKTKNGKRYADLLTEMLAEIPEATHNELSAFVKKFIDYGVVCSSLQPPLTGVNPARYVLQQLEAIPVAKNEARQLRSLLDAMQDYDTYAPGEAEAVLHRLTADVYRAYALPNRQTPLNVDLTVRFAGSPSMQQSIADDAARLAEILLRISQRDPDSGPLTHYRQKFIGRYGRDRLVPLLELIRPGIGLGVPAHYMAVTRHGEKSGTPTSEYDRILLGIAVEALRKKQLVAQIDTHTIERLTNPRVTDVALPRSLDIAVQIAAHSHEQVNKKEYLLLASPLTGAQTAGRTIGRFADLLGNKTIGYLQSLADLQAAQNPGCIQAELVYMPHSGHAANVAIRPRLRPYEITLGTTPGVVDDYVLHFDDLYVGLHNDRFYLWSASQQKPVVVWYGHMLNTVSAPSVCRLLVDISRDGEYPLTSFSWGVAGYLPVLPRLTYGRLVLSPAEWKLNAQEVLGSTGKNTKADRAERGIWHKKLQVWRKQWQVPQYVYLTERDNRLLLNLDREDHAAELFYAATAHGKMHQLCLQEALPGPNDAWIVGEGGHYIPECIFQILRKSENTSASYVLPGLTTKPAYAVQRVYIPGDTWVFCKLYISVAQQDDYLAVYVDQLVRFVFEKQAAETWFFVRYADPEFHIRLRFKVSNTIMSRSLTSILVSWAAKMQAAGLLQRFCIDQYEREIERYGGAKAIETAEAIFAAESELCLSLICAQQSGQLGDISLLQAAVLTTSILLMSFGLDDLRQSAWAKARHGSHARFTQDYRKDRQKIILLLRQYKTGEVANCQVGEACKTLEQRLKALGGHYRQLERSGHLGLPLEYILESFVHMHTNRLIGMDRIQEQRLLTYLYRALTDMPYWTTSAKRKQNP